VGDKRHGLYNKHIMVRYDLLLC